MFGWPRRSTRSGSSISDGESRSGGDPKSKLSDDELRAGLRHAALKHLADHHGLMPVYMDALRSEEAFEAAYEQMPLIAVWNERQTPTGISFSLSVNPFHIWMALTEFMSTQDPWLEDECDRMVSELKTATHSSLLRTIQKTGLMPSAICAQLS